MMDEASATDRPSQIVIGKTQHNTKGIFANYEFGTPIINLS